jgi:hypothetical protein
MYKKTSKILKRCLHGCIVAATCTGANAQNATKPAIDSSAKPIVKAVADTAAVKLPDTYFQKPHWAIGVSTGSNAFVGFDVACSIAPKWNAKIGYNYFDLVYNNLAPILKAAKLPAGVQGEATLALSQFAFTAEWTPTRSKNVRLALGGVYYVANRITGKIVYTNSIALNDMVLSPAEVGTMTMTYSTASKISPYFGIGFGRTVPKKRVGLSLDLGAIQKGAPVIGIEATGLLKSNDANAPILTRNLEKFQWHPVANLRLAVKLN